MTNLGKSYEVGQTFGSYFSYFDIVYASAVKLEKQLQFLNLKFPIGQGLIQRNLQPLQNINHTLLDTLPTAEILSGKNVRAFLVCGFLMKLFKKNILKI